MQTWNYPTAIRFGAGALTTLPDACRELGITRPLLVTDPGLATLAICTQAVQTCVDAGLPTTVFADVHKNPVGADVMAGVAAYHDGGHDGVIAMGGGAGMDVGKAIALMVGQDRPLFDFEDVGDNWTRVREDGMAPVVAVPTTSGTGSEVGRASVIVEERTHTKRILFHPKMLPARVVADPALTVGLPASVTAATGMDALSHNLEAYCVDSFHPLADGIAVEGMKRVHRSLVRATKTPTDLDARADMMAASLMGATAFQKGLGAMHAMAHPIGAVHDTHHGLTNAVLMPYVLAFNRPAIDAKLTDLARALGLATPGFVGVLDWVLDLRSTLGIPHTLSDLGLSDGDVDALVPMALEDPSASGNPIVLEEAGMRSLFANALHGTLP